MPERDQMQTISVRHRALSLTQPWATAITRFGKRIENRTKWKGCSYRGSIWLHASATMGRQFSEAAHGMRLALERDDRKEDWDLFADRHLFSRGGMWRPQPTFVHRAMGAIVGRANVVDVIADRIDFDRWCGDAATLVDVAQRRRQGVWWMGGFALVLSDVVAIEPVPVKGALGLWRLPDPIADAAMVGYRASISAGSREGAHGV